MPHTAFVSLRIRLALYYLSKSIFPIIPLRWEDGAIEKWATRLAAPALEPDGAVVLAPQPARWVSGVRGCLEGNITRYFT